MSIPSSVVVASRHSRTWSVPGPMYPWAVMDVRETKNVSLGRTSLVVAASDGPGG